MNKKSLYILGLFFGATTLVYGEISTKGLAHCGGLFLFENDSKDISGTFCQIADTTHAGKYSAFASFTHYKVKGLWEDGWNLSLNSNYTVGSAGFNADFRNIGFGISASSLPSFTSSITVHAKDSSLYARASLERGNIELAKVRWESENEKDEVHLISATWETDYLRRGFAVGGFQGNNSANISLNQFKTTPHLQHSEHFLKDSSEVWIWDAEYAHLFNQSKFDFYYAGISTDIHLFGNTYRENSTKRFMYLPLEGIMHYGDIRWDNSLWGVQARGLKTNIQMNRSTKRLHETLAPNRLLPVSLSQTLSFSFLQKNYLIDTDLDIAAATFGGHIRPSFKATTHTTIVPKFELHGYYTYDEFVLDKTSEATTLIAYRANDEHWKWSFESYGAIAGLGLSIERTFNESQPRIAFEWDATQIIPFKTDLHEHNKAKKTKDTDTKNSAGVESSGIFKNGFASHLGISVKF